MLSKIVKPNFVANVFSILFLLIVESVTKVNLVQIKLE